MVSYTTKGNQKLTNWNYYDPVIQRGRVKNMVDFKEATNGEVVKFEKDGDSIEGVFMGYEESRQYPSSYAVKIKQKEGIKTVFVSGIVVDLIENNSIKKGQEIKIEYLGKKTAEKSGREYNDYKVLFK